MVLDALAAGKDVYVEKPLCHTPEEGVQLVEAERHTKQIVQVGMQRRSYDLYLDGAKLVANGALGNVRMVRSWWLNNYVGNGGSRTAKLGAALDWEQWQGPVKTKNPAGSVHLSELEKHRRVRGWDCDGSGCACLRRDPPADERRLSVSSDGRCR
jgi:predicted dehydrogenase